MFQVTSVQPWQMRNIRPFSVTKTFYTICVWPKQQQQQKTLPKTLIFPFNLRSASAVYYRKQTIWRAYIHLSPCRIYIEFLIKRNYNRVLNYAWHANCGVGKRDTTRSRSPNNSDLSKSTTCSSWILKWFIKRSLLFVNLVYIYDFF